MALEFLTDAAHEGELIVKYGDSKFRITANGPTPLVEHGFEAEVLTGKDKERFLNKVLLEIEGNSSKMSKEAKATLSNAIEHFGGADAALHGRVKASIEAAKRIESAANPDEMMAALRVKGAVNFITEAGERNMTELKFDLAGFQKLEAAAAAELETLTKARKELTGILTAEKKDAKALQAFMDKNAGRLSELDPAATDVAAFHRATKFNFTAAKAAISTEISTLTSEAESKVKELISLRDRINLKPENAAELEKEAGVIEKRLGEISKHKYGSIVKSNLPEALGKELAEVHPTFASSFKTGNAVVQGSKDAIKEAKQTGKWYSLFHGEEKLAAIAQKEGNAVSELGFMSKLRPGKTAAVVGVAGIAAAYLAGVGRNPDKGKYTQIANDNEMQAGAAVSR